VEHKTHLEDGPRARVPLVGGVDKLHHGGDGRVEAHLLRLLGDLLDAGVEELELLLGGLLVGERGGGVCLAGDQPVHPGEEAVDALDALGVPHFRLPQRSHEHLVETEGVGAVAIDDVVRVDHVAAALAHLVGPGGDGHRRVRLEDVSGRVCAAGLRLHLVLVQPLCDGVRGALGDNVALLVDVHAVLQPAEDHALGDKLLEGFLRRDGAHVEQNLVPEPCVEQVEHGVLRAAHVQVDRHPVLLGLRADQLLRVGRVHVPEVVPARP